MTDIKKPAKVKLSKQLTLFKELKEVKYDPELMMGLQEIATKLGEPLWYIRKLRDQNHAHFDSRFPAVACVYQNAYYFLRGEVAQYYYDQPSRFVDADPRIWYWGAGEKHSG